jgi:cytochrome bd-type quinol oxidase subunit 1
MRRRMGQGAGSGGCRLQFTFTIMYHYLFPILTMGLAPFIAVLKTLHLARRDAQYAAAILPDG